MASRFYSSLLIVSLLLLINACTTTSRSPVEVTSPPPVQEQSTETEDNPSQDMQRNPSDRSLEEIIRLSTSTLMPQPDLALEITRSLESIPSGQLKTMIDSQLYDPEFTEWLELALLLRTTLINGDPITSAADDWANYHYGHVINHVNFLKLVADYKSYYPRPAQVAYLLPAEGGLAAAGKAIRDGIMSAYLDEPGNSQVRFYSSGDNSETAVAAYFQARADGATQIVGPLRLESTRALADLEIMDIPVLLLNEATQDEQAGNSQGSNANSLSLSQAAEAATVANLILAEGRKQAIVIAPDSDWGKRIESAFISTFQQGGGQITDTAYFDPATSDHSAMLTQLLEIDISEQRKADLQLRLGIPLTFEPIRRDDFDFIFMAANPSEGRELKPLLRFHDAGDIPVYAMGRIYSGRAQQSSDQDLNGVIFPTTRWQLQVAKSGSPKLNSIRGGAFGNLYALGQDAWQLLPWLPLMQKDPDLWFPGNTGALRMQPGGQLFREPAWAQFSDGQPVPYQWVTNN